MIAGLNIQTGGRLDLDGYDIGFTSPAAVSNHGTIRLNGTEALTNVNNLDTDSGTVEYMGDGDGAADTFALRDFGSTDYYNLTIAATDGTLDWFNGQTLTIAHDFTISAGNLTHADNSTVETYKLNVTVGNDLVIAPGGTINVDGKGYQGGAMTHSGNGPGAPGSSEGSSSGGGGYGGEGGSGVWGANGKTYGSIDNPTNLGSSGASAWGRGGAGGGAVILTVSGTTTVNGAITAKGSTGQSYAGAGSGGTVNLTTGTLEGTGTISVQGGFSMGQYGGGGGGGGRMAVKLTSSSSFGDVNLNASGDGFWDGWDYHEGDGSRGGASGTIYRQTQNQADGTGELIVPTSYYYLDDDTGYLLCSPTVVEGTTEYPTEAATRLSQAEAVSYSFSSITVKTRGNLQVDSDDTLSIGGAGATLTVESGATLTNDGALDLGGSIFAVDGTVNFDAAGNRVTYTGQSDDQDVQVIAATYDSLVLDNLGSLFVAQGAITIQDSLDIVHGSFDINGYDLTTSGATFSNDDTLILQGGETITGLSMDTDSGTVVYSGTGSYASLAAGSTTTTSALREQAAGHWPMTWTWTGTWRSRPARWMPTPTRRRTSPLAATG